MKAVRASIVAEQEVEFETFELPDRPSGAEVLLRMERSIISAGTELANYTGLDPDTRVPGMWCAYPWRPGYGGIGRVVEVGPGVHDVAVGDRLYGFFNHASYALEDTDERMLVRVPENLDSTTAIMTRMCGVAITGYRRAHVNLGDTVVMIGLGLVGNLASQFFLNAGQRVIGLDPAAHRRALADEVGLTLTLDNSNLTEDELIARIREFNNGELPPTVIDAVGDSRIVERAIFWTADNGEVITLGTPRKPYQGDVTLGLKRAHFHSVSIIGAMEWKYPLLKRQTSGVSLEGNTELIMAMIADGRLKVKPLISHVIAPSDLNRAYQGLLHEKDSYLGVILDWENNAEPLPAK